MVNYQEFLEKVQEKFKSFVIEATAGMKNQAAALRARKLSMELRNDFKDFRVISVENDQSIRESKKGTPE